MQVPKFNLYGSHDQQFRSLLQPEIGLRNWDDLARAEKLIALDYFKGNHLFNPDDEIVSVLNELNRDFLRLCPAKRLMATRAQNPHDLSHHREAAFNDFQDLFLEATEPLFLRMISILASRKILHNFDVLIKEADTKLAAKESIDMAFLAFDGFAIHVNHVFEQFSVQWLLTRTAIIPRQEEVITTAVYVPVMKALFEPKWKSLSEDLSQMFKEFGDQRYPECITMAHRSVQRFLQILANEESKNGEGQVGRLFSKLKTEGKIVSNRFTEPLVGVIQSFISSERATKSTAKPTSINPTSIDTLLVMNVVMVFLQFCLQNPQAD